MGSTCMNCGASVPNGSGGVICRMCYQGVFGLPPIMGGMSREEYLASSRPKSTPKPPKPKSRPMKRAQVGALSPSPRSLPVPTWSPRAHQETSRPLPSTARPRQSPRDRREAEEGGGGTLLFLSLFLLFALHEETRQALHRSHHVSRQEVDPLPPLPFFVIFLS
jgi:hypothetical protein